MDCRNVEKLLSNYLDGSLEITDRNEVVEHLAQCQNCMHELNAMTKLDNLLKLKAKERPSKEYFENYWQRLACKLDKITPQLSENRRWFNPLFIPKFSSAFSGILIALLIFINGLLYINIRELTSLNLTLSQRQEEMQKEVCRYLTKLDKSVIINKNVVKF